MSHLDIVIALFTVAGALVGVWMRLMDVFGRLGVEHEILLEDYCERKGIERSDLPTRHRGVFSALFKIKLPNGGD